MKNKKLTILTLSVMLAAASPVRSFASDEQISYDDVNLDQIFVEEIEEIEYHDELNIEDSDLSTEDFLAKESKEITDLPVVYYDARSIDRLLDPSYKEEDTPAVPTANKGSQASLKNGSIYEKQDGKEAVAKNKWVEIDGEKYYAGADGKAFTGYQKIGDSNYFFNKDSKLVRNDSLIADGGKYQADNDGALSLIEKPKAGWASIGDKSYYFDNYGKLVRGLADLGENRYFFDRFDGQMVKNQIMTDGNDKIHTASDGIAHYVGWDYHNGKLGYFNEDGSYSKGLKTIAGKTYGFDENGKIFNRQNKKFANQWYYFNQYGEALKTDGRFKTGWVGDRYYFADGKPAEGLQVIDGNTYIFHELTLEKQRNTQKVFNHTLYKIDGNGVARAAGKVDTTPSKKGTNGQFAPGYSKNLGRKTPYFTQNDPRWKNNRYASGSFGGYGCGPTAMAMVLNRKLNRNDIYPTNTAVDARHYTSWNGTDWQYLIEGPEIYGLKSYEVPVNEKAFIQVLKNNPIIVRVGNGYFINNGHYMVIDSYKDGKFYINDPFYSQRNTMAAHDFWRLRNEVTVAWEIK